MAGAELVVDSHESMIASSEFKLRTRDGVTEYTAVIDITLGHRNSDEVKGYEDVAKKRVGSGRQVDNSWVRNVRVDADQLRRGDTRTSIYR